MLKIVSLLSVYVLAASAQQPMISPGGIVNAGSFVNGPVITSGAILSVFGRNLASGTQSATGYPLPAVLGGTSVTVNGFAARLFYVSPTQVNFQVPNRLVNEGNTQPVNELPVAVTTVSGSTEGVIVSGAHDALGIFTQQASGCGPGAVQNFGSDGSVVLNSYVQSVSPGSFISVYGTGLGLVYFPPPKVNPQRVTRYPAPLHQREQSLGCTVLFRFP